MRNRHVRGLIVLLGVAITLASGGCGYTLRPPFNKTIKTVYLPTFKSTRFRRDLNLQLTEMVKTEIQNRTPFTVVGSPEGADATLQGVVSFDDKTLMLVNPDNLPRQLQATMYVTVSFTDNRTGITTTTKAPASMVAEISQFFPEIGETASLGFQKAMQKLARDVVNMMEDPWGDEYRVDPDMPRVDPDDVQALPRRSRGLIFN